MNLKNGLLIATGTVMATTAISPASQAALAQSRPTLSQAAVEQELATVATQMAANPNGYTNSTLIAAEARGLTLLLRFRLKESWSQTTEQYGAQVTTGFCQNAAFRQFTDHYGVVLDISAAATNGSGTHRFQIDRATCAGATGVAFAHALTDQELLAAARSVRGFKPNDEFDAPPTMPQFAARTFSYELQVKKRGSGGCSSLPHWGYRAASQELDVTFVGTMTTPLGASGDNDAVLSKISYSVHFLPLTCSHREGASYRAENAFGAQKTVYRSEETAVGVGHEGLGSDLGFVSLKMAVPPDEARSITESLKVRVSGRIGEWLPGVTLVCGRQVGYARFDHPWENTTNACVYRATLEKVEVLDGRTGRVLAIHRPNLPDN